MQINPTPMMIFIFIIFIFTNIAIKGGRFIPEINDMGNYKVMMRLTINSVTKNDFGTYKCVSRNSLGETEGSIKLYRKQKKKKKTNGKCK
jgi:hypothetical protein